MTPEDDVRELRKALEDGPTPGPWFVQFGDDGRHMCCTAISAANTRVRNDGQWSAADCDALVALTLHQCYPFVSADCERDEANSAYIAAASPDRIRRILDRLENERAAGFVEASRMHGAEIESLRSRLEAAEKVNERQEDALNRLQEWAKAYPLECFPEPDFKKAHQLLLAGGMTLDAISASNMRHVITQVAAIVDEAQKGTP